jgi:tol-pal system protein YbgF
MFSNLKQVVMLTLLASAASPVLAAPAPVSDLDGDSSASYAVNNETDIQRLERLLSTRNRAQLQMQKQLDDLALDVQDLRGQIERNSYDMQQALDRQRELFVELDKVRGEMKSTPSDAQATNATSTQSEGTFSDNADEQTAYQNAVDLILKKRDYDGAITAFNKFLKSFPNSTFAPNSHYWLGQLYFAKKQDKQATQSFEAVVTYRDSSKRPDALAKLGEIAQRNKQSDSAKKYYSQVIAEYPDSTSAKAAQKALSN